MRQYALVNQITALTLLAVLILAAISIINISANPVSEKIITLSTSRPLIGLWIVGLLLAMGLVAGTILGMHPLGMYFGSPYPSYQLLVRGLKTDAYNQLNEAPDIAIMGSSRAFTLSPQYIHETLGYTAYNMAVEGGRIEDILI